MKLFLPVVFLACFVGCATKQKITYKDLILPEAIKSNAEPPNMLTYEQVKEDTAILIHNLKRGYSGRLFFKDKTLTNASTKIGEIKGPISNIEFCEKIAAIFDDIPDNHLQVRLNKKNCKAKKKSHPDIGDTLAKKKNKTWLVELHKKGKKNILYISIASFPTHKDPVWNGFLDKVKNLHKKADVIVLDLRSNGGGDDTIGYQLSAYLHKTKDYFGFPSPIEKQITSQTPETQILKINMAELAMLEKMVPENIALEWRKESEAILEKVLSGEVEEFKVTNEEQIPKDWKFKGFETPVYILMNTKCYSSCESTIDTFEYNPFVKKIGTNTGGMVHFGNIAVLFLKNSLLFIQTPTHVNFYRDGRFIEQKSIKPDIEVKDGTDAYDYLAREVL